MIKQQLLSLVLADRLKVFTQIEVMILTQLMETAEIVRNQLFLGPLIVGISGTDSHLNESSSISVNTY